MLGYRYRYPKLYDFYYIVIYKSSIMNFVIEIVNIALFDSYEYKNIRVRRKQSDLKFVLLLPYYYLL